MTNHVLKARLVYELAELDFRRAIARALEDGATQREVAETAHVTQSAISQRMKNARELTHVKEGFSGATPFEVCERYAAGLLTREQLCHELATWPYEPISQTENDLSEVELEKPGTWIDVQIAMGLGYIDLDIVTDVYNARHDLA